MNLWLGLILAIITLLIPALIFLKGNYFLATTISGPILLFFIYILSKLKWVEVYKVGVHAKSFWSGKKIWECCFDDIQKINITMLRGLEYKLEIIAKNGIKYKENLTGYPEDFTQYFLKKGIPCFKRYHVHDKFKKTKLKNYQKNK